MHKTTGFLLLLILLCGFVSCRGPSSPEPSARRGVLDLTDWNFEKDGNIKLNGEWEFYWQKFLEPQPDKDKQVQQKPDLYIEVPSVWNKAVINGKPLKGSGYATYKLTILLPENINEVPLAIRTRDESTSYKLYANDKLLAESGTVGYSIYSYSPQYKHLVKPLQPENGKIVLLMQIANFHYQKGGMWESLLLGSEEKITRKTYSYFALDLLVFGALFLMSFYHLALYILRPDERSALYFFFLTLIIAVRILFRSEMSIDTLIPNINFHFHVAVEYMTVYLSVPLFMMFLHNLFNETFRDIPTVVIIAVSALFALTPVVLPIHIFTSLIRLYQLIAMLAVIFIIQGLIAAVVKRYEGAVPALAGTIVLVLTSINDVLYTSNILNIGEMAYLGLLVFVFCQAFILALKFSRAFRSIEKLSGHLKEINIANSRLIPREMLSFLNKKSIVDIQLGDHVEQNMCVMFADIRNFTALSESMSPEDNFRFINSYLSRIGPIISAEKGFIDKYMGDGIMALFPNKAEDAINAAVRMQREIIKYNQHRQRLNYRPVQAGIGIHAGSLMLGTVGEKNRMDATVISDSVNLSSRIEGLTKFYNVQIIITSNVLDAVHNKAAFGYRQLGHVKVKGKTKSVTIYEIYDGYPPEKQALISQTRKDFENGIEYFYRSDFRNAAVYFQKVLNLHPQDKTASLFLEKAAARQLP